VNHLEISAAEKECDVDETLINVREEREKKKAERSDDKMSGIFL
jgi:hypothetical protein